VKLRTIQLPRVFLASVLSAQLIVTPALATHEVEHRYVVLGEVLFEDGSPAVDETIELKVGNGVSLGTVTTNEQGRYRVLLHVHDTDVGKAFDMTVGEAKKKVTIEFDPTDHETERGKRVDFTIKH
jgi:hypothetical protein